MFRDVRDGGVARRLGQTSKIARATADEHDMSAKRKITVRVPVNLLSKAQAVTRAGVTETVIRGLEHLAAADAYDRLLEMRGKVRLSQTFEELKDDR
jgi:hypothetical protein